MEEFIVCRSEEGAIDLMSKLYMKGFHWDNSEEINDTKWDIFGDKTIYIINEQEKIVRISSFKFHTVRIDHERRKKTQVIIYKEKELWQTNGNCD